MSNFDWIMFTLCLIIFAVFAYKVLTAIDLLTMRYLRLEMALEKTVNELALDIWELNRIAADPEENTLYKDNRNYGRENN